MWGQTEGCTTWQKSRSWSGATKGLTVEIRIYSNPPLFHCRLHSRRRRDCSTERPCSTGSGKMLSRRKQREWGWGLSQRSFKEKMIFWFWIFEAIDNICTIITTHLYLLFSHILSLSTFYKLVATVLLQTWVSTNTTKLIYTIRVFLVFYVLPYNQHKISHHNFLDSAIKIFLKRKN